jgi:hypothetical protein
MRYHPSSRARLTEEETHALESYLRIFWPDALWSPLLVTEGYEFHQTSLPSSRDAKVLVVGRGALYERIADAALTDKSRGRRLRALYFPGATPSRELLNQSCLYFDEIFYISPGSTVFENRHHPYGDSDEKGVQSYRERERAFLERITKFDKEALSLKQAGILRPLLPTMQHHPDFIKLLTADLDDAEFKAIAQEHVPDLAFVAARKMEPLLPLVGTGMTTDQIHTELDRRAHYAGFGERKPELFGSNHYGVKCVDGTLGASILLSHALLLGESNNLIPITDDIGGQRLLARKLERISALEKFPDYRRELDLKAATLALRVLEIYVPKFEFSTFDDALETRERLRASLENFRSQMAAFAAQINATPYSKDLLREIENTVAGKVRPAVDALENEIQKSKDSFVMKVIRNAKTGSIPIVASMFAGLPASAVLGLSAGILTIEAAIETWQEVKRHKKNGLSLLIGKAAR